MNRYHTEIQLRDECVERLNRLSAIRSSRNCFYSGVLNLTQVIFQHFES